MAEDHAKWLAGFFGKSAPPVESPTGVWLHKLAVTETDVDFPDRMALEISRDRGRPDFYTGVLPSQLTFNVGPRSLLNGAVSLVIPRFHHFDDPTQIVGAGTSLPFLRGLYNVANLQEADPDVADLFLQISAVPGTGGADFDILAKLGLATTYDGAAIPVFVGNDTESNPIFQRLLHTASNVDVGQSEDLPVEAHWKDATGATVLDEFRIPRRRDVWTQTLPTKAVFNEIAIFVRVDGLEERTRDLSLTFTRPGERDEAIGGRFVDQVLEQGQRTYAGQLNRRALSRTFTDRLIAGEPFELEVDAASIPIGATGIRRRMKLIAKNCRASGRTPSVGGRATFDEAIAFRCHPSVDVTYPAAMTVEVTNSQASLA